MSNIKFVISTELGFVNKSQVDAKLSAAKTFNTIGSAKLYAQELGLPEFNVSEVVSATKFGITSVELSREVSAEEIAEAKMPERATEDSYEPKATLVILNADTGMFLNKKGEETADPAKAFTSPNPDRLAGISVAAGVVGEIHAATKFYTGHKYTLVVEPENLAVVPVDASGAQVKDDVISVF